MQKKEGQLINSPTRIDRGKGERERENEEKRESRERERKRERKSKRDREVLGERGACRLLVLQYK